MKRLIIFLVRKRLGLKKGEHFRFIEQKHRGDYYYFESECLKKVTVDGNIMVEGLSRVSLNWLLNDDCVIQKSGIFEPMGEAG